MTNDVRVLEKLLRASEKTPSIRDLKGDAGEPLTGRVVGATNGVITAMLTNLIGGTK